MTTFEYIVGQLTERDFAALFTTNSLLFERELNKKVSSNSVLAEDKIFKAWKKFCFSFLSAYHTGNGYKPDTEYHPNVFYFERVCLDGTDDWRRYGHGRMVAFQIWLESPYNPSHWDNE